MSQRHQELASGKVLDVSKLDANGVGAKVIDQPTNKSKKKQVPGLKLVSDNLVGVQNALNQLHAETGLDYSNYLAQYQNVMAAPAPAAVNVLPPPAAVVVAPVRAASPLRRSPVLPPPAATAAASTLPRPATVPGLPPARRVTTPVRQ